MEIHKIKQMKTITFTTLFLLMIAGTNGSAQEADSVEKYGKALNLGIVLDTMDM